jgi:transposase InsO family protein
VKRSTLQDQLGKLGFTKRQLTRAAEAQDELGGRRFQRLHRNDLVQGDCKHGPKIGGKKTYLISLIDDSTRFVLHSEYYRSESVADTADCLRKAVEKWGAPRETYFDRGGAYRSRHMGRACAMLGIRKRLAPAGRAESKGKIEKFHQVVDSFHSELRLDKVDTLEEINRMWGYYLEVYYQDFEHSALEPGVTPRRAFDADPAPLRIKTPEEVWDAFLVAETRKVNKSGCFSFKSKEWTAEGLGVCNGERVEIFWVLQDQSRVWVESDKLPRRPAAPMVPRETLPKKPEKPAPRVQPKPDGSRLLRAAERECRRRESIVAATLGIRSGDDPEAGGKPPPVPAGPEAAAGPGVGAPPPAPDGPVAKRLAVSFRRPDGSGEGPGSAGAGTRPRGRPAVSFTSLTRDK